MPYNVTSWFIDQAVQKFPSNFVRKFTIGSSDYSAYVKKWPTYKIAWDDVRKKSISVPLSNEDQSFNFFLTDNSNIKKSVQLDIGFTHPSSGDELITIVQGDIDRVRFNSGECNINFSDKFKVLSERVIGSSENAQVYSDYPSQIAWDILVDVCGFDNTASTANTDIDYTSFDEWNDLFVDNVINMATSIEGEKASAILKKISEYTQSAIYVQNNKVFFNRFTQPSSYQSSFDASNIRGLAATVDDDRIINAQIVSAAYDVASTYHTITVSTSDSTSINSFGVRQEIAEDEQIWYVTSASALDYAQRIMATRSQPYAQVTISTGLVALPRFIGETLVVIDQQLNLEDAYRIMGLSIDIDKAMMTFDCDKSTLTTAFRLDVSELDGTDTLA